jgi:DNA-binding GntR family transcriptional regulator
MLHFVTGNSGWTSVKKTATRAQKIQATLADDIVRGRIPPGEPLDEVRLAAAFGVSRTPIREALRQLEAIGLAEARPHRGAVAASISAERLDEMFAVMGELEALCARRSALHMTPLERRDLEEIQTEGGRLTAAGSIADYAEYNNRFHETIYRGAHNGFLAELTASVRQRLAPFRKAQFEGLGRLQKSHQEHDRVVRAILRGDGDTAAAEMRAHIVVVRDAVDDVVVEGARRSAPERDQASAAAGAVDLAPR